jgi:hypothetical protein
VAALPHALRGEPDVSDTEGAVGLGQVDAAQRLRPARRRRRARQFDRLLDAITEKLPAVAEHLEAARADILAFTAFPKAIWRQIWSNNRVDDHTDTNSDQQEVTLPAITA